MKSQKNDQYVIRFVKIENLNSADIHLMLIEQQN